MADEIMNKNELAATETEGKKEVSLNGLEAGGLIGLAAVGAGTLIWKGAKGIKWAVQTLRKAAKDQKEGVKTETTAKVDGQEVKAEVVDKPKEPEEEKKEK